MRLHDTKIKTRLLVNSGLSLLLFLLALGIYYYALSESQSAFDDVLEVEHAVSDQAAIIGIKIQQSRKNEKNFRLNLDKSYAQKVYVFVDDIIKMADGINKFALERRDEEIVLLSRKIIAHTRAYGELFRQIVKVYEDKGLTPDSGLQGQFRKAAHKLFEQDTMEHAVGDILAEIDALRISQKSLWRQDDKGKKEFQRMYVNFGIMLGQHKLMGQMSNDLLDAFSSYKDIVKQAMNGGSKELLGQMNQELDRMTAVTYPMFVPDVRTLVLQIRRHEKDYLIRGGKHYVDLTHKSIANLLKAFKDSNIKDEHIVNLKESVDTYLANFDALVDRNRELALLNDRLTTEYAKIEQFMAKMADQAKMQNAAARNSIITLTSRLTWLSLAICLAAIFLSLLFTLLIINSITGSIEIFSKSVTKMRDGDYTARVEMDSKDEIGHLGRMFNQMVVLIAHNAWQATGRNILAEELRGNKDEKTLCRDVLLALAKYIQAQVGTLYTSRDDGSLRLTATYSFTRRKNLLTVIEPGDGLVGEAALEKETILISQVPEDYIRVESSLGNTVPRNIIAVPLIWQEKVLGVVELASINEFSESQLEFLKKSAESIAIAINSSRQRDITQSLLEESQRQSEELQAQQEELQAANEEMEEKNKILEKSEERLKNQQEELQAANEELEEKGEALSLQKEAVQKKNDALELARLETEKKAEELAASSRYKSEFLANMSHELRSPLNSLLLLANNLSHNREGNLHENQLESINIIHNSGQDLLNLINDILDLSKIEAGRMEVASDEVGLRGFADWLQGNFGHIAKDKGIDFKVEIEPDTPSSIITDRQRLEQIIRNLLTNAIKFTSKGGVIVRFNRPTATQKPMAEGLDEKSAVAMTVIDTGIGIPADKQSLIFDAFKQVDGSTSRQYGGTGLGLSIVKQLTALLGGEIRVSSVEGEGSEFTILLPIRHTAESTSAYDGSRTSPAISETAGDDISTKESVAEEPAVLHVAADLPLPPAIIDDDRDDLTGAEKVLLIIEDDQNFARILMAQSREKGFKCLVAVAGVEGLQLAERFKPGAIILDIRLPDINGWQVLETLKANPALRHIPVHMMSAEEKTINAMQKGAIGFLTKPVTEDDMQTAFGRLENALQGRVRELLVVEDDPVGRDHISGLVGGEDVRVTTADDGKNALALLEEKKFDCMILDIGLPDMTGFELLDQLRNQGRHIPPVIIYTGRGLTREEEKSLSKYTETVIVKGVKSEERLLDETALFLHRLMSDMPVEKRQMIASLYDQDSMFKDKRILVVDDDMRNAFALSQILEERGMIISIADDGAKAVEILTKDNKFDLILMDIMMPGMDGYEAMRRIRKDDNLAQIPIITLTAKAMAEDKRRCMEAGASDYLTKPVEEGRLLSMMRVWLYR